MESRHISYIYAVSAVLLWSTAATAFKLTLRVLTPSIMLVWAAGISCAFFWTALAVKGRLPRVHSLDGRRLLSSAILGFLNPFLYYTVLFHAYSVLTAQEALVLNYTWPVMLVLLSVPLLGHRLGLRSIGGLLVSFAGIMVIATGGNVLSFRLSDPVGVGLALGSSVVWALYWLFNVRDRREPLEKLAWNFLFGFACSLLFAWSRGELRMPVELGFAGSVYIGLFEMGVTFLFWLKALSLAESASRIGNLVFLSPFLSLVFIGAVVGETVRVSTVAGLVLIISGIVLEHGAGRVSHAGG